MPVKGSSQGNIAIIKAFFSRNFASPDKRMAQEFVFWGERMGSKYKILFLRPKRHILVRNNVISRILIVKSVYRGVGCKLTEEFKKKTSRVT